MSNREKIRNELLTASPDAVLNSRAFDKIVKIATAHQYLVDDKVSNTDNKLNSPASKAIFNSFVGNTSNKTSIKNAYTSQSDVGGLPIKIGSILMQRQPELLGLSIAGVQPLERSQGAINYATYEVNNKALGATQPLTQGSLAVKANYGTGTQVADSPSVQDMFTSAPFSSRDNYEGAPDNELIMKIKSAPVTSKERKMNAELTQEALEDFRAAHNSNLGTALLDRLTQAVIFESDREILSTLYTTATAGDVIDVTKFTAVAGNQLSNATQLVGELIKRADKLAVTAQLGSSVFIITTSAVASVLVSTGNITGGEVTANGFSAYLGKLTGTGIDVYVDRHIAHDTASKQSVCIGLDDVTGAGSSVIWSPYIPMTIQETTGENTGNLNMIARSRGCVTANPYGIDLSPIAGKSILSTVCQVIL